MNVKTMNLINSVVAFTDNTGANRTGLLKLIEGDWLQIITSDGEVRIHESLLLPTCPPNGIRVTPSPTTPRNRGTFGVANGTELTRAEIEKLQTGDKVEVIWSTGNGPRDITIRNDLTYGDVHATATVAELLKDNAYVSRLP